MEYFDGNSQLIEQIKTRFYLYEIVKYIDSMCTKAIQNIRSKSGAESAIEDVVSYIDHSKKFKNSEGKSPADYRRNSRIGG